MSVKIIINTIIRLISTAKHLIMRRIMVVKWHRMSTPLRINYGCGLSRQDGYVNIDMRWTPAIDIYADLEWCARHFSGKCDEVYMSHVLEHYGSPGKAMRNGPETVIGALKAARKMLRKDGILRVAVPDFGAVAKLYSEGRVPFFPRILGRLCGEQNYPENLHRCMFDRIFLEMCLLSSGFDHIEEWDPIAMGLHPDASFDEINGERTSLNLLAHKSASNS